MEGTLRFSLSTNWCNRRIESGEAIADKATELGFGELELGYHTTLQQAKGFKARLDQIPVGSVHAFCPVPISAPQGYPELYQLASFDDEGRRMAKLMIGRNVAFAADMGADTLVLHAGRVMCRGFLRRWDMKRRVKRGRKMVDVFKRELEALVPVLEGNKVTLGLENLPYLEGFPQEWELKDVVGDWVKPWLDTGHAYVCTSKNWSSDAAKQLPPAPRSPISNLKSQIPNPQSPISNPQSPIPNLKSQIPNLKSPIPNPQSQIPNPKSQISNLSPVGLHITDSVGGDDHLPPGEGKVDFAALKPVAEKARHLVFEPHAEVSEESLKKGLATLSALWT